MNESIDDIQKMNDLEWFIIAEDARITSPTFKVFIPKLTTGIGNGSEPVDSEDEIDSSGLLNDNIKVSPIKNSNYFIVNNYTPYRLEHHGHVEIESIEIEEMTQATVSTETELAGPGPHKHAVIKPIESKKISAKKLTGKNIRLFDLNRSIVKKGTRVLGACINGNIHDMGVLVIPGAIILGADRSDESFGCTEI